MRNEDYYKEISNYLNKKSDYDSILKKIILSRNVSLFCKILDTCNDNDKNEYFLKNENSIFKFLKENDWKNGQKIFKLFVDCWKTDGSVKQP